MKSIKQVADKAATSTAPFRAGFMAYLGIVTAQLLILAGLGVLVFVAALLA